MNRASFTARIKAHHAVERLEVDEDGYWAILKPGFVQQGEFTHCVHEDTARKCLAKLAEVIPCKCAGRCALTPRPLG